MEKSKERNKQMEVNYVPKEDILVASVYSPRSYKDSSKSSEFDRTQHSTP